MNPGDLTTYANASQWLGLAGVAISGVTNANPCVITTLQANTLVSGMPVLLSNIGGTVELNGLTVTVTKIDAQNFSIGIDSTGFGVYTSGGQIDISATLLQRLISSCSAFVQSWLDRTIANADYIEPRNGQGNPSMLTMNYPITSVAQVNAQGVLIQPRPPYMANGAVTFSTPFGAGYTFSDIAIYLTGYAFPRGYQNIILQYAAGFLVPNEAQSIPLTAPYQLSTLAHWSAADRGVVFPISGQVLQAVGSDPAEGQYTVDASLYTFSAADAGAAVAISYAYVPYDLEQAVVDMIGEWFTYRGRIGMKSVGIEQQTTTFTDVAIPTRAQGIMQQYKRVAPVQ